MSHVYIKPLSSPKKSKNKMTYLKQPFTKAFLNGLTANPDKGRYVVYDANQNGLALRVSENNVKSFVVMKKHNGKTVRLTLGRYPDMSIQEARKATIKSLSLFNSGINPNTKKKEYKEQQTLQELFNEFMERYSKKEKKSWIHDERDIPKFFGHWFNRKICDITKLEIQELFEKITKENGKYQANHVLERLRAMYNKAIEWGWKGYNPTNNIKKNRTEKRDRYLSEDEFTRFNNVLEKESLIHRSFFLLLLYTGARKSNVLAMRWEDIDFKLNQWRIPDTKNGEPAYIPLISQAKDILLNLPKNSKWVFPNPKDPTKHYVWFNRVWKEILKEANLKNIRMHDLRRTMGSWQAITGASLLTIGKSLGHKSNQATEIYARLSKDPVQNSMQLAMDRLTGNKK